MSDAPAIPDPLARYRLAPATVRAGLSAMYNDIERAPDEQGLSAASNDALLFVSRMLHAGKVSSDDARDLDELLSSSKNVTLRTWRSMRDENHRPARPGAAPTMWAEVLRILDTIEAAESVPAVDSANQYAQGFVLGLETA